MYVLVTGRILTTYAGEGLAFASGMMMTGLFVAKSIITKFPCEECCRCAHAKSTAMIGN